MTPPRSCLIALSLVIPSLALAAGDETKKPLREVIDAEVRAVWEREKIAAPALADDATFLRRVYIDLVGTIPTLQEARKFLDDKDPKKRDKLIDQLLADKRFATQQAHVWDLVLFGRNPPGGDATRNRDGFRKWLAEQFAKGVPYDQWAKALLLAEEEGTSQFLGQFRNQPEEATVAVSKTFLGTQLQCARCHDHPYEKWTQRDFYGMAAFFARLAFVESGSGNMRTIKVGEKSSGDVLFSGAAKDQKPGKKGEPIKPKFLGGDPLEEPPVPAGFKEPPADGNKLPPKPTFSRKEKLAAWVTTADNPYFARAAANRVWGQFMGRGLIHPIDDLSEKNEPSHPALLDAMTRELVAHKFDLKWLMREIVSSRAYQATSEGSSPDALPRWFERARVRPLSAEELLGTLRVGLWYTETDKLPSGMLEYILRAFGDPTNGRGEFQGSMAEHLFLMNAPHLRQMTQPRKGNLADGMLTSKAPVEERVEQLFLSLLTRPPRKHEREVMVKHLSSGGKPEILVEEAIWAIINVSEFRFNR